jgi:hypothetical protein
MTSTRPGDAAQVDFLVDEKGNPIELERDTSVEAASDLEPSVGATGPTNWWRLGLVALLAIVVVLLGMQLLSGNKGTDVIPGTPVAAPQNNVPVPVSQ